MTFRHQDHRESAAKADRNRLQAERKKTLSRAHNKARWANRVADADIAAYVAKNPVALCNRPTEVNFGEEE